MAGRIFFMEDLTGPGFRELEHNKTMVFLGVSPLEVHGPHLPLKTDYLITGEVLKQAGEAARERFPDHDFLVAPVLRMGSDVLPLPGSVSVRPRVLMEVLADVGAAFARAGFPVVALVSGHGGPRHNAAMELASKKINKRFPKTRMFSLTSPLIIGFLSGDSGKELADRYRGPLSREQVEGLLPSDIHAGALETSLALKFMPGEVDDCHRDLPPVWLGKGTRPAHRALRVFMEAALGLSSLFSSKDPNAETNRRFMRNLAESINHWEIPQGEVPSYAGCPAYAGPELAETYLDMILTKGLDILEGVAIGKIPVEETYTLFSRSILLRLSMLFP